MELSEMNLKDVETRIAELDKEVSAMTNSADVDKATEEKRSLLERKAELTALEQRKQAALDLTAGTVKPDKVIESRKEVIEMGKTIKTTEEIRKSPEYLHAFARGIRTGDYAECRAMLTTNATVDTGYYPVPERVDPIIRHAWENEQIMALIGKTNVKGNVKVAFELTADDAVIHLEGDEAPDAEELAFGYVLLVPQTLKKWIPISDEVLDLDDGSFVDYIMSELIYRILKLGAKIVVTKIMALPTTATSSSVAAAQITAAPALGTTAEAIANLSDEAGKPTIAMNKLTYSEFTKAKYAANYAADPFEGCNVVFNNDIPAYSAADAGDVYMIVGDFARGVQANFPNGQNPTIKFDPYTLATEDMNRFIGRLPVAIECVGPNCFVNVLKPSTEGGNTAGDGNGEEIPDGDGEDVPGDD